jgi:predicted enzyme related to lactoylglutathione lyase
VAPGTDAEVTVYRVGAVSYLRIPAPDPHRVAAFYEAVFGWRVDRDRDEPSFADGSGHVIGHFVAGQQPAGEAGIRPYVFVEDVDGALAKAGANGGEVETQPYAEGDLWVATFRDPAGSVVGVWQRGPRSSAGSA